METVREKDVELDEGAEGAECEGRWWRDDAELRQEVVSS